MDRGRSLVPLAATDAAAYSTPLVGCWVAGAADVKHPIVAAACLRYLCWWAWSRALFGHACRCVNGRPLPVCNFLLTQ